MIQPNFVPRKHSEKLSVPIKYRSVNFIMKEKKHFPPVFD